MSQFVAPIAEWCAAIVEAIGIGVIVIASAYALGFIVWRLLRAEHGAQAMEEVRHRLGRGILLGLEFLVAADIIHTVAVELTFRTVGVLALVVAIRTFLSFSLELEITGRWPWQKRLSPDAGSGSAPADQ